MAAAFAIGAGAFLTRKAVDWSSGGCDCYDRILPHEAWMGVLALAVAFYAVGLVLFIDAARRILRGER